MCRAQMTALVLLWFDSQTRRVKVGILLLELGEYLSSRYRFHFVAVQTPIPQGENVFDLLGLISSGSPGVTPDVFADDGASGSKTRHSRTQHGRPAEGVEQSVLHNEWGKGIMLCCHLRRS